MRPDADITVVGGGLIGSVFALAAAHGGLRVTLVDAAAESGRLPRFDGRAYAVSNSSCRLLRALGFAELLAQHSQDIRNIQITDGRAGEGAGPAVLGFDSAEIETGPMARMVEDRHLRHALGRAVAASSGIRRVVPAQIERVEFEGGQATAVTDAGARFTSWMIAGCDGRRGVVAAAADIRHTVKDYRQSSIVCAVEHQRPHAGAAHQFFMPPGPLAILPLQGNRSSLVWTADTDYAERAAALENDGFLRELRPRFGSFLGDIELIGARTVLPLSLTLAERTVASRAALLGEAAHGLHPLAGQGLNLGFRDAASLAETLATARRRGEDIGTLDVLERYQSWRRFDTALFAAATDSCNWLFSNDNPFMRTARGAGMMAVAQLPFLRRALIREAAGLNGALPALMSGHPA